MDRPGVRQVPEGGGEQGKMEKIACTITCGAPTTLAVMGQTIMMIIFPWEYVAEDIAFLLPQDLSCSCEFVSGYFDTSQPLGIVSECHHRTNITKSPLEEHYKVTIRLTSQCHHRTDVTESPPD